MNLSFVWLETSIIGKIKVWTQRSGFSQRIFRRIAGFSWIPGGGWLKVCFVISNQKRASRLQERVLAFYSWLTRTNVVRSSPPKKIRKFFLESSFNIKKRKIPISPAYSIGTSFLYIHWDVCWSTYIKWIVRKHG